MESSKQKMDIKIRFLSLNLFLRPPPICTNETDYKDARSRYFSSILLRKYDIICLQEVFSALSNRRKKIIEKAMEQKFKYIVGSPDPPILSGCILDCGLLILSKYPIVESDFFPFTEALYPDRATYKGLLYAKIQVSNAVINLFTTHLQSKHPTTSSQKYMDYRITRRSQLQEISSIIRHKSNKDDFIIIAGDLNVDGKEELKPPPFPDIVLDDYSCMINILSSELEIIDLLRTKYGHSPATFGRIGDDGNGIEKVLTKDDQSKWDESLDYILISPCASVRVDWDDVKIEPFYTPGHPFTQISDHVGVQASFIINS